MMMVIILLMCALSACAQNQGDPIDAIKKLNEDGYTVKVLADDEDIVDFTEKCEVKHNGVYLIIAAVPDASNEDKAGVFFYCNSDDIAKELEEDLHTYLNKEKNEEAMESFVRGTVECAGSVVFMGCEDAWEVIK